MNDQRNTSVGEAPADERAESTPEAPVDGPATGPATGPAAGPASGSGEALSSDAAAAEAATLRSERDEYKDLLLRKTAEFDNYRRRIERERRELSDYATENLLRDILPLVDDLERALVAAVPVGKDAQETRAATTAVQAYRTGIELILRQLHELLRKRGVTPIDSVGTDFDPHLHQAVTQEPSADHREGEVIAELARGYKLGDRLLRPAMVKVATRE